MSYEDFIASKTRLERESHDIKYKIPSIVKPFQADIIKWALRLGRCAIFADTGLGKTLMQLHWAQAIVKHMGKRVLIIAPLAVTHQTIAECKKFNITKDIAYCTSPKGIDTSIVVTNYERVDQFDMSDFIGVVLDESSIIKHESSKTRNMLIDMCQSVQYKLCCTATPAPNDFIELGNHAEFLGVMSQKEMLATWFIHEGALRAGDRPEWRLKGHASQDFWRWVSTWAIVIKDPNDLGYDEPAYKLPRMHQHVILAKTDKHIPDPGSFFPKRAGTLQERLQAKRITIEERTALVAKIIQDDPDKDGQWLLWCHLNTESEMLHRLLPDATVVTGSDDPEDKAERLLGFAAKEHKCLISKPSICGFGLNFQSCHRMIFVGVNDSFESLYQAIRRCWRFGQTKEVHVYIIASEMEANVTRNLQRKEANMKLMGKAMLEHMHSLTLSNLQSAPLTRQIQKHDQELELPSWL